MTADATPARNAEPAQVRLELTFPADPSRISGIVERVVEIAREVHCSSGKELEIGLAVAEALANAVKHGCHNDAGKNVYLRLSTEPSGAIAILVRDPGEGFDLRTVPDPRVGAGLESDHGRGLHMIRQLMDEVRFERGGAEIHMRKN
jgi:serine/threonine-protein kinase RsbW